MGGRAAREEVDEDDAAALTLRDHVHWRLEMLGGAVNRYVEHSMPTHAAAVSFWAMVGLVPLLATVVFGVAIFADTEWITSFMANVSAALPSETVDVIEGQLISWVDVAAEVPTIGLFLAVLIAGWGGSLGISKLMRALAVAYGLDRRSWARVRTGALLYTVVTVLVAMPFAVIVVAAPTALLIAEAPLWIRIAAGVIRWPAAFAMFALVLYSLYGSVGPRRPWRTRTTGVVVAATLFIIASAALSIYAANSDKYDASYGSLGAVVLTLLWMYGSTSAVLLGAEADVVRHEWSVSAPEGRGGKPSPDA